MIDQPDMTREYEDHQVDGVTVRVRTNSPTGYWDIPPCPGNRDYDMYQAWLQAGGVPAVIDDTPPDPSADDLARQQFNAQYTVADIVDALQQQQAGDATAMSAIISARSSIQAQAANLANNIKKVTA